MKKILCVLAIGLAMTSVVMAQEYDEGEYYPAAQAPDVTDLQVNNARVSEQLAAANKEIESLKAQIKELQARIDASDSASAKQQQDNLDALQKQVADLEAKVAKADSDSIDERQKEIADLKQNVTDLDKKVTAAEKEKTEQKDAQIAELQGQVKTLQDEKTATAAAADSAKNTQIETLQGQIKDLNDQIGKLNAAAEQAQDDQITALDGQVKALQGQIDQLNRKETERKDKEIESLQSQNTDLQASVDSSRVPVPAPTQHISKLSATLLNAFLPFGIGSYLQGGTGVGVAVTIVDAFAVVLGGLYLVDTVMSTSYTGSALDNVNVKFEHGTDSFLNKLGGQFGLDLPLKDLVLVGAVTFAVIGRVVGISGALSHKESFYFAPLVNEQGQIGAGVRVNF